MTMNDDELREAWGLPPDTARQELDGQFVHRLFATGQGRPERFVSIVSGEALAAGSASSAGRRKARVRNARRNTEALGISDPDPRPTLVDLRTPDSDLNH